MVTQLYRVPTQNNLQYTLGSALAQGASTAVLNTDVTGVVRAPGVFVVDRVDASGNKTPTAREYISFTGVSTTNLTGLTKGLAGSTDQAHSVGAIVEFIPDVTWADAIYTVQTTEHDVYGVHQSLASVQILNVLKSLSASGASLQGFPIRPVFSFPGGMSGASSPMGPSLIMPNNGQLQWITAVLRNPASQASLALAIQKNGTDILNGSYLFTIPLNGTYISLASIATNTFNAGDIFTAGVSSASSFAGNLTIQGFAR